MPLEVGSRLGHYEVTALVGEGGMGQVYSATDTKLNRQVALKILPEAFASDPDRLARFQREAQVLASLNHPGIAAIHGIEESDGQQALVLELVEGPTLADRIAKGPIPLDEALPIAKQIAEALEAAHEAGVIHRDLKPANIKVRDDGTVKVLDFGLAKALDPSPEGDPSQSPTLTAAATQMGVIMGTAAYMSPEQAAGKTVDKRGDIWSFGVVLFEMLTGQRLFTGETVSHVLAKVLDRDLDFTVLPTTTPAPVRRLLRRCLERTPKRRLAGIGEALIHLEEAHEASARESFVDVAPLAAAQHGWRRALPWATGVAIGGLIAGLASWMLTRPAAVPPTPPSRFAVSVPANSANYFNPVLSPDGQTVAYSVNLQSRWQVYVRRLDELEARPLQGTEDVYTNGGISPDGQQLLVTDAAATPRMLKRVPLTGGPATPIREDPNNGATWGPDGTIVQGADEGLLLIPTSGGEPTLLTQASEEEGGYLNPRFLPDGRAVLFHTWNGDRAVSQVVVYDFETQEQHTLLPGMSPQYAASGHLVFWRENSLWAVLFDLDRLEVTGTPVLLIQGVQANNAGFAGYAVGSDGTLVYVPLQQEASLRSLTWVTREGIQEPLAAEPRPYFEVQLSPDGRQVATEVREPDNTDIWIYDIERNTPTRFTFDPARDLWPLWTLDGERIVFTSTRGGNLNLYWKAANGIGAVERLTTSGSIQAPHSFAPDGKLVFGDDPPEPAVDLHVLQLDGERETEVLVQTEFRDATGDVSPDGRWLAYVSDASGVPNVYVRPFPNVDDGRWQISRDGGIVPQWGPDSRELFYQVESTGGIVMMVAANKTEPTFSPGNPIRLFEGPYAAGIFGRHHVYDISPDGQRLLMIKNVEAADGTSQIVFVLNWFEELKRLVPVE